MTTQDIFQRFRVGLALLVGFVSGRLLGEYFPQHGSEFFIGGFLLGFLLTHAAYWIFDTVFAGRHASD